MKKIQFSKKINAPKEKVWNTLWQDKTFRKWANIIDAGTYMVGELKEGSELQFISSENGYGVTSLVQRLIKNEFILLKHSADTQQSGKEKRQKQWTGSEEIYSLEEKDGFTILSVIFDVPKALEEYFNIQYPKALEQIKEMAEKE